MSNQQPTDQPSWYPRFQEAIERWKTAGHSVTVYQNCFTVESGNVSLTTEFIRDNVTDIYFYKPYHEIFKLVVETAGDDMSDVMEIDSFVQAASDKEAILRYEYLKTVVAKLAMLRPKDLRQATRDEFVQFLSNIMANRQEMSA